MYDSPLKSPRRGYRSWHDSLRRWTKLAAPGRNARRGCCHRMALRGRRDRARPACGQSRSGVRLEPGGAHSRRRLYDVHLGADVADRGAAPTRSIGPSGSIGCRSSSPTSRAATRRFCLSAAARMASRAPKESPQRVVGPGARHEYRGGRIGAGAQSAVVLCRFARKKAAQRTT